MLTITRVWQEFAMSLSLSKSLFPGKYLAEDHEAALVCSPELWFQPQSSPALAPAPACFALSACTPIFQCMPTAHRQCSLVAQGGQVFHVEFPTPDFPHDACFPPKTCNPLSQVPTAGAVLGPWLDPAPGSWVWFYSQNNCPESHGNTSWMCLPQSVVCFLDATSWMWLLMTGAVNPHSCEIVLRCVFVGPGR